MVSRRGLMQCQINWNIAARYTIGSIKIYIVTYVGKNTCFLYVYSNVRKLNIFTFCLVCCGKQKTWGGLNDLFLITTFTIYWFLYFKILYSRENSPKLSLSAKTHRDSAIWVISGKLDISSNEEHFKLLQDSLKLSRGKWHVSKI